MLAGALAGMVEHTLMFPVDTIKTRMQAYTGVGQFSPTVGTVRAVQGIVAAEGAGVLWRGITAVALSAGPAHAIYFAIYEATKRRMVDVRGGHQPLAVAACGAAATIAADAVMTPLDVVKQRMQLGRKQEGLWQVIRRVHRDQGIGAFYKGYKTTLVMNVPYTAVQFAVYESMKRGILELRGVDETGYSAGNHIIAGAVAGGCASAVTNPFDVVKTRLQTQGEEGARRYRSMTQAATSIMAEEGFPGFLRGIWPRIYFHAVRNE
mmetsp:Transcript_13534/g.27665  ORF Transcript_13534/g.27665 Transcript_13534/m.27665 type:complete len:264 (-) Transcript_13534:953-1744(-)